MESRATNSGIQVFQALKGRSNSYLIHFGEVNILIDTGKETAFRQLIRNIDDLNQ